MISYGSIRMGLERLSGLWAFLLSLTTSHILEKSADKTADKTGLKAVYDSGKLTVSSEEENQAYF